MATGRSIVPVSALDALATAGARRIAGPVAAWIDAQRGEVFASLYDATGTRVLHEPSSLPAVPTRSRRGQLALTGGRRPFHRRRRRAIRGRHPRAARSARALLPAPPLAGIVGRLAAAAPDRAVLPHAVVPIYIRGRTSSWPGRDAAE